MYKFRWNIINRKKDFIRITEPREFSLFYEILGDIRLNNQKHVLAPKKRTQTIKNSMFRFKTPTLPPGTDNLRFAELKK